LIIGRSPAVWALFALLILLATVSLATGMRQAWLSNGDFDMRTRVSEYASFRAGVYPNRVLEGSSSPPPVPYTVYPPYALPMFAFFFEPGGTLQGRILIESMSLASLVVIGIYGFRQLAFAGPALASVGGIAGAAIMANSTALALGQFSIISAGLIAQQIIFLERKRPVAAGVCWALAMLKPQMALAFAVLFLLDRQWRGLAIGVVMLAALSLFACWWTEVPPVRVIQHFTFHSPVTFSDTISVTGPAQMAGRLGLNPRLAQLLALMALGMFAALCWWLAPLRLEEAATRAQVAGVCAVLGELLFYHRHYDNIMLFPTILGMLALAASAPSWVTLGTTALMGLTIWVPQRVIELIPYGALLRSLIWVMVAMVLLTRVVRGNRPAGNADR
jgi:hypothetical protein